MKLIKKLLWHWRCFWGTRYFIKPVKEGLKEDEILVSGHRIYILHKISQKDDI
jgi:hypothetical protein